MISEIKEADKIIDELNNINAEQVETLRTKLEKCTSSVTDISVQGGRRLHSREDALLLLAEMDLMVDNSKEKIDDIYKKIKDRNLKIYFDKVYYKMNNAKLQLKYGLTKSQINKIIKKIKKEHSMRP